MYLFFILKRIKFMCVIYVNSDLELLIKTYYFYD